MSDRVMAAQQTLPNSGTSFNTVADHEALPLKLTHLFAYTLGFIQHTLIVVGKSVSRPLAI